MRRLALCAAVALLVAGCGSSSSSLKPLSSLGQLQPAPNPGKDGPELVPIPNAPALGLPAATARVAKGVDGIKCERNEPVVFHIHTHLTVFVDGKPRLVPAGIGVWPPLEKQSGKLGQFVLTQNECLSWLVTRFADGIIHIEAPVKRSFTLGEFFDVWGQPLGPNVAGSAHGRVTAIVDGKVWTANPRDIPLREHTQIQLEVGRPLVAPETITFPGSY
jgi:hypothetical protein